MKRLFYRAWKILKIPLNILGSVISLLMTVVLLQAAYKVIFSDTNLSNKIFFSALTLVGIAVFTWMNFSIWMRRKD